MDDNDLLLDSISLLGAIFPLHC